MTRVYGFGEQVPRIGPNAWVAPDAPVIGDVDVGADSSIWYGCVVRGDVFGIRIGRGTNIQDHTVIHVTSGTHGTTIGDDVTIGHRATLHGCTIGDRALVGIGAIVLDAAVIGEEALVGAGALVTPGTIIPPRVLAVGSPARVKRPLTEDELAHLRQSGPHYVTLARAHARSVRVVDLP